MGVKLHYLELVVIQINIERSTTFCHSTENKNILKQNLFDQLIYDEVVK